MIVSKCSHNGPLRGNGIRHYFYPKIYICINHATIISNTFHPLSLMNITEQLPEFAYLGYQSKWVFVVIAGAFAIFYHFAGVFYIIVNENITVGIMHKAS